MQKLDAMRPELSDNVRIIPREHKGVSAARNTGIEAATRLDSEAAVEQAIGSLLNRGFPMTVGYDKEKQKLYKKDLAAFRHRVRSGSL